jgi:hypothetical protein
MTKVITEASAIACSHKGKVIIPASKRLLTVSGNAVLVYGDEAKGSVGANCTNKPPPPPKKPCTKTLTAIAGIATKLKVGGQFVLLQTASGPTDSARTPGTWNVESAGQTKLDAI